MKKMKLNLDQLQVESFNVLSGTNTPKGTVYGNYPTALNCWTKDPKCQSATDDEPTCNDSCFDDCSIQCLSDFRECNMTIAYPNCYTEGDICP